MKITILGSGPCAAIPRKACGCPTCRDARRPKSKSQRTRSSALLQKGGASLLIDCGPDFLEQAKREKLKRVDAVILTHLHSDAAGGLRKLDRCLDKPVFVYTEKANTTRLLKKCKKLKYIKFEFFDVGRVFRICGFAISAYRVSHGLTSGFPTVGYVVDGRLGYISDVGEIPKNNLKYFKNLDILFLDSAMWFEKKMRGHLNAGQAIALGKILRPKKLILTQIGHGYPPYEKARREIARQARAAGFGGHTILGFDGFKI